MEEDQQFQQAPVESSYNSASWISKTYGWWMNSLVWKIYRNKETRLQDMPEVPRDVESKTLEDRLHRYNKERLGGNESRLQLSSFFLKTLYRLAPGDFIALIVTTVISALCFVAQAYLVDGLLRAFLNESQQLLYIYGGCITSVTIFTATFYYSRLFYSEMLGIKLRSAYSSAIFTKVLNMSEYEISGINTGKIISLISVDASLLLNGSTNLFGIVELPVIIIFGFLVCWWLIGWITVIAFTIMIVQTIAQLQLGKIFGKLREKATDQTDAKMVLVNDLLHGIKIIKMHAWELLFQEEVQATRKKEFAFLGKSVILRAVVIAVYFLIARFALFVIIIACYLLNYEFPLTQLFSLLAIMNILKVTFGYVLPTLFETGAECLVSLARIEKFLAIETASCPTLPIISEPQNQEAGNVTLDSVTCSWINDKDKLAIEDITISAKTGQLIGIIGPVGSGKTTILKAIMGEIPTLSGKIKVGGRIAYVPQDAFAFPASIKQNISFGSTKDECKLQKAIEICCLTEDIATFPKGLQQPVGERGICLSGGQKARLNLARAVYDDADIYLLDDPFSAVDTKVGQQIYEKCIVNFMKDKTCILVTNQVHFLKDASEIFLLESGKCIAQGNYNEVSAKHGKIGTLFDNKHNASTPHHVQATVQDIMANMDMEENDPLLTENLGIASDTRSKGNIGRKIYWSYLTTGSKYFPLIFFLTSAIAGVTLTVAFESWLKIWVNAESEEVRRIHSLNASLFENGTVIELSPGIDRSYYLWVLAVLMGSSALCVFFAFNVIGGICCKASQGLHTSLLQRVIRAKMAIFETQSIGNFLSRFSMDMSRIDTILPFRVCDFAVDSFSVTTFSTLIVLQNYWLALPCAVIFAVIGFFFKIINKLVRDVKRVEGIARGPVYSHLANAILGATVVRAFHKKDLIIKEFQLLLNRHSSTIFILNGVNSWGCESVNITSSLYIVCIVFTMIFSQGSSEGSTLTGNTGLALVSCFVLNEVIFWICFQFSHVECEMTSVERVLAYCELPLESDLESLPNKKPPQDWPKKGEITFQDVSLSYSDNANDILHNLNFSIKPSEKIGIVGKTGAGKSSIFTTIYRLHEPRGRILIDDLCISELGLHDLRTMLSIIPQDPILFCGTIRKNLDPFGSHEDEKLWFALGKVQMLEVIKMLPGCLDSNVSEGGLNFSVGERQLLCLARALLRGNKILMMDEATANIDVRNDEIIQSTIKLHFKDSTVITIAHRLKNVLDMDRIMVVDKGEIAEFDEPQILLQNRDGVLYNLVHQRGDLPSNLGVHTAEATQL